MKGVFEKIIFFFTTIAVVLLAFSHVSLVFADDSLFGAERQTIAPQLRLERDQFYGAFVHEYPITAPPGRNGLEPNLSLTYSNQNLDQVSPFGYGWSVNIPYIERINKRGLNKMYTRSDFYSTLDGELVATSTVGYGALTENGDFRQYVFVGNNYWKVTDKFGTVYTFGTTSSSQLVNTASSTQVYRWMLEEVRDRNDNYIKYEYYKDDDQIYPAKITYTGNGSVDGIYQIVFARESRSDLTTSNVSGFPVGSNYRIKEIDIKVNGSLVRSYQLGYTTGANSMRSLLASTTESGVDEAGASTTLPARLFTYGGYTSGWSYNGAWHMPKNFVESDKDNGVRFYDYNGDGLTDIVWSTGSPNNAVYVNNGNGSWATSTPTITAFVSGSGQDTGNRIIDIDGDLNASVEINSYFPLEMVHFTGSAYLDTGTRLVDINGDGLVDLIRATSTAPYSDSNGIYLYNGSTWDATSTNPTWVMPTGVLVGDSRFADFNGDGLTDIIKSRSGNVPYIYLNDGDGSWTEIEPTGLTSAVNFSSPGAINGIEVVDLNGDGLADIADTVNDLRWINKRDGKTFSSSSTLLIDTHFVVSNHDGGSRFVDINGDGLLDVIKSYSGSYSPTGNNGAYMANGKVPDLLTQVTTEAGGTIDVTYKPSTQYTLNGSRTNPEFPLMVQTAESVLKNDGFGTLASTSYSYGGGHFYYADVTDRKFAGFATSTTIDPLGNVTNTFFHQGNGSANSVETDDEKSKIGKPYLEEVYDGSNNLYSKTVTKWESESLTNGRKFVKKYKVTDMLYDGNGDHRDKASVFEYNASTGNLATTTEYGEVTANADGSFVDTNDDIRSTVLSYATNSSKGMYGLPKTERVYKGGGVIETSTPALTYSLDLERSSNQYLVHADHNDFEPGSGDLTLELWYKPESDPPNTGVDDGHHIFYKMAAGDNRSWSFIYLQESGVKKFAFRCSALGSDGPWQQKITASLTTGTWYHIALVWKQSTNSAELFIDGVSQGTGTGNVSNCTSIYNGTAQLELSAFGGEMDGKASLVRVWKTARTQSQLDTYKTSVLGTTSNLSAEWTFDNTYADNTGNGHTLTAYNSPVFSLDVPSPSSSTTTAPLILASERNFYYDSQALGAVTTGNLTKEERLVSTTSPSTYIDTEKTYNAYGLVATEKDPRDKTTTYSYESQNLFVGTTTNPVGHITETYRDYTSGKVKKLVDANRSAFETVYDGLDRVTAEKVPDHLGATSTLVTKTAYTYTDTRSARSVQKTTNLSTATSSDTYTYFDGFDRPIQTRIEAEGVDTYNVQDTKYNARGEVATSTLPYSGGGSARQSMSGDSDLYLAYAYDPLKRVKTITNNQGTETHSYDQWRETVKDRENNFKSFVYNAFGKLKQVDENDGTGTSTTAYTYDTLDNLSKITDAASNVRNFTYNALSRLTKSEDLHTTADTTFASTTYTYDDSGNISSKLDQKNQLVNYTYDDINRVLTEDYTGSSGTEISYVYDTCGNGKGRMCGATTTNSTTNLGYDAIGNKVSEIRRIDNATTTTRFEYDRVGNVASTTHPNGTQVRNNYNSAGLLEAIFAKPAGSAAETTVISNLDYAPTGQISRRNYGNGLETLFTYDENELYRLRSIQTVGGGSAGTSTSALGTYSLDLESSSSQYASISDGSQSGLDFSTGITLETWVKFESLPSSGSVMSIMSKRVGATNNRQYEFYLYNDSGTYKLGIMITSHANNVDSVTYMNWTPSTNTWYHVAVTWSESGELVTMYVNGSSIGTSGLVLDPPTTIVNAAAPFAIGAGDNGDINYLDGKLALSRAWEVERTASEIDNNKGVVLGATANLKGEWRFENSYADNSGNSNTLTGQNSPVFAVDSPTVVTSTGTSGTVFQNITYTYDNVGNITQIADNSAGGLGKTVNYIYDDLYRLTDATTATASSSPYDYELEYNSLGNITSFGTTTPVTTYSYDGTNYANPHAATTIGSVTQTYDNNGNLVTVGTTNYTWDYRDRLTKIASSSPSSTFGYDETNTRVWQAFNSATTTYPSMAYSTSTTGTSTVYIYAGDTLLSSIEQIGTLTPVFRYIHPDHLGGTNVVTNSSSTTVQAIDYYPYGQKRIDTGSADESKEYIGQHFDEQTELSYLNARYYGGTQGRFLSQDPVFWEVGQTDEGRIALLDPQSMNSYSYAGNNPITQSDPNGRWYKEFITGQQSWADFQIEIGQATNQLSQDSNIWDAAIDHPVLGGAAVGVGAGAAAYGVSAGLTALSIQYLGGLGTACITLCNKAQQITQNISSLTSQQLNSIRSLTSQQIRSIDSLQKNITQHQQKLKDYISNPYKFDNKGILKNATNDKIRQQIIDGRINKLTKEIKKFSNEINKILKKGK